MNKRQAKKALKKKYGPYPNTLDLDPDELATAISNIDIQDLANKAAVAIASMVEIMWKWAKEINERFAEVGLEATIAELETENVKLDEMEGKQ